MGSAKLAPCRRPRLHPRYHRGGRYRPGRNQRNAQGQIGNRGRFAARRAGRSGCVRPAARAGGGGGGDQGRQGWVLRRPEPAPAGAARPSEGEQGQLIRVGGAARLHATTPQPSLCRWGCRCRSSFAWPLWAWAGTACADGDSGARRPPGRWRGDCPLHTPACTSSRWATA